MGVLRRSAFLVTVTTVTAACSPTITVRAPVRSVRTPHSVLSVIRPDGVEDFPPDAILEAGGDVVVSSGRRVGTVYDDDTVDVPATAGERFGKLVVTAKGDPGLVAAGGVVLVAGILLSWVAAIVWIDGNTQSCSGFLGGVGCLGTGLAGMGFGVLGTCGSLAVGVPLLSVGVNANLRVEWRATSVAWSF